MLSEKAECLFWRLIKTKGIDNAEVTAIMASIKYIGEMEYKEKEKFEKLYGQTIMKTLDSLYRSEYT